MVFPYNNVDPARLHQNFVFNIIEEKWWK